MSENDDRTSSVHDEDAPGEPASRPEAPAAVGSPVPEAGSGPGSASESASASEEPPGEHGSGGMRGIVRETAIVVGTALVLSLLIKTFLAQAFYIPSESMEGTLIRDDRVLVNLLEPGPFDLERGDIVVFKDPGGWLGPAFERETTPVGEAVVEVLTFVGVLPQDAGEHLIKRVIGLPGDQVVCCDDDGRLTVNGEPIEEDYLPSGTEPSTLTFDITVPEGRIWVMGDNRGFSQDSRYHQDLEGGGTVSEELVVGRAAVLFWPLDRFGTLSNHADVFDDVPAPGTSQGRGPGSTGGPAGGS